MIPPPTSLGLSGETRRGAVMRTAKTGSFGVDWSQQYGAKCPGCGRYTKKSYKQGPWRAGYKLRYHQCPNGACRCRFKSVADDPVGRMCPPDAEPSAYHV